MISPTCFFRIASFALALCIGVAPSAAQTISGVVTNKTTNKPAAGDDVVLLKLAQGMQELTRSKSDSHGRFTLKIPAGEAASLHLVRVTHDRANYFSPVPAGTTTVDVEVYTAAAELDGVAVSEDVIRMQTTPDGNTLRVDEHYLLRNDSEPAKTLFSDHPFELYLPAGATVQGASAKAPGGMGVEQPLVPMDGPNHYAIIFPIRPGETEFNVFYRIPYKDSFTFQLRPTMPTGAVGIMMPRSMNFKPAPGTPYSPVPTDQIGGKAQAFMASNVTPSQPLGFTVSGKGELPRDTVAQTGNAPAAQGDPNADTRPGGGLGTPLDKDAERESWVSKYKWPIILVTFLLMVGAAGIAVARTPPAAAVPSTDSALQVLRDELFAVETDRLEGRLTDAAYAELKAAYDIVLRRALARTAREPQADS